MNFLNETIGAINNSGHTTDDVMFIGSSDGKYRIKFDEFALLANFEYDNGFGGQELFGTIWYTDGTWADRGEYDGSEWWQNNVCPIVPEELRY